MLEVSGPLPERLAVAVEALAARTTDTDGVAPLDDDARLGLRLTHQPPRRHLLALSENEDAAGYAQVDAAAGQVALVVAPAARRAGLGSRLLAAAAAGLPGLSGWAHGDLPAATGFARHHGLVAQRRLLQLRRDLADTARTPEAPAPSGYRLRAFVPGQDDAQWLAVNAAAFTDLPDQGGMTQADLDARIREPWFDPAGLLLAETVDGRLAGFHWTKVHAATEDDPTPAGEVYVLGVHPDHQGTGLGRALLTAGLEHLRAAGLRRVLLYVDGANTPAVRLYERLGFAVHRTDTLYRTRL